MIIKDYILLKLSDEPDTNGTTWSKNCIVNYPETLSIHSFYDTSKPLLGKCFNIRKEDSLIFVDVDVYDDLLYTKICENYYQVVPSCLMNNYRPDNKLLLETESVVLLDITLNLCSVTTKPSIIIDRK